MGDESCKTLYIQKCTNSIKTISLPVRKSLCDYDVKSVNQFQSMNMVYSRYCRRHVVGSLHCVVFLKGC